jgi:4-carboxymuconolactone decarboxylase
MQPAQPGPRIAPLQPPYAPDIEQALRRWMGADSAAEPLLLFRTLNLHAELASRMRPLGAGILGRGATVPPPLREVVIHRTCALTGARYEWGVHASVFARELGFSDAQLYSTVHGDALDDCWDVRQASVFGLADELHATSTLSDPLWRELAAQFSTEQLLELIVTAGWYHVIGYVCNGTRVPFEQWAHAYPEPRATAAPQA